MQTLLLLVRRELCAPGRPCDSRTVHRKVGTALPPALATSTVFGDPSLALEPSATEQQDEHGTSQSAVKILQSCFGSCEPKAIWGHGRHKSAEAGTINGSLGSKSANLLRFVQKSPIFSAGTGKNKASKIREVGCFRIWRGEGDIEQEDLRT